MNVNFTAYNNALSEPDQKISEKLVSVIDHNLTFTESKIWHAHPVWFIEGNPIVGYSKLKDGIRLMFWSGADFNEPLLTVGSGKFKDASITYQSESEVNTSDIKRWLKKAETIQWDYKNIVKRKGKLVKM